MTVSLRGHYTGEENVTGNSAERSVLRRLMRKTLKTGSEGADVTCCGRQFQTLIEHSETALNAAHRPKGYRNDDKNRRKIQEMYKTSA